MEILPFFSLTVSCSSYMSRRKRNWGTAYILQKEKQVNNDAIMWLSINASVPSSWPWKALTRSLTRLRKSYRVNRWISISAFSSRISDSNGGVGGNRGGFPYGFYGPRINQEQIQRCKDYSKENFRREKNKSDSHVSGELLHIWNRPSRPFGKTLG